LELAHFLPLFDLGGGVCSNARTASSNLTPLKFGIITLDNFFVAFDRFGTDSLSASRYVRSFLFNKAILLAT
jgi:hypothetical protein